MLEKRSRHAGFRAMADQTNVPNAFLSIFTPAELRVIARSLRLYRPKVDAPSGSTKSPRWPARHARRPKAGDKVNLTKQESNGLFMCLRRVGSDSNLCWCRKHNYDARFGSAATAICGVVLAPRLQINRCHLT